MSTASHCSLAACLCVVMVLAASGAQGKPRLIVLTDIGGDPDDQQSMVRLMVYANEFEVEGLIASASGTPGELKKDVVQPQLIREIVEAYGKVRDNLVQHDPGYPTVEYLLEHIKSGNPHRGVDNLGQGQDTEGSQWIIQVVDKPEPRPVNVCIWGGSTELAQALWRVRNDRGPEGLKTFLSRLRVHAIGHQDNTGPWILQNFPELFYILDHSRDGQKLNSCYRGMFLGGDESLTSREWIDTHVRTNHGPLGALYPPKTWTASNPHGALKEGDTPSWFYFLENGLNVPAEPSWGGWGGRFERNGTFYQDAHDTVGQETSGRATVWRWRPAYQNDFQARMDWCVKSFAEANHPPVAVLNGDKTRNHLTIKARAGDKVTLDASGTSDPDGDALSYRWWVYQEAGTYAGRVVVKDDRSAKAVVEVPADAAGKSIHLILEVQDSGEPRLIGYRRAVIKVVNG